MLYPLSEKNSKLPFCHHPAVLNKKLISLGFEVIVFPDYPPSDAWSILTDLNKGDIFLIPVIIISSLP